MVLGGLAVCGALAGCSSANKATNPTPSALDRSICKALRSAESHTVAWLPKSFITDLETSGNVFFKGGGACVGPS
jgi:hypothetical protein